MIGPIYFISTAVNTSHRHMENVLVALTSVNAGFVNGMDEVSTVNSIKKTDINKY